MAKGVETRPSGAGGFAVAVEMTVDLFEDLQRAERPARRGNRHRSSTGTVTTTVHRFDTLAVRYGIEPGSVPGAQLIQVRDRPSCQRTSLPRVELPFVAETD